MSKQRSALRNVLGMLAGILIAATVFWAAGGSWVRGWWFLGCAFVVHGLATAYVWRKDPEVLRRRGEIGAGTPSWDYVFLFGFTVFLLALFYVAAFDTRYGWSDMPLWVSVLGAVLYLVFVAGFSRCQVENTFFEKTVRFQEDRDHSVIDTGPYRFVRHPGYFFVNFGMLPGTALVLGWYWALLPAAATALSLVARIVLEERLLRRELVGYEEYMKRVRYRLLPGIW